MEKAIIDYLTTEKKQKPAVATMLCEKVSRYDDIKSEFLEWLDKRNFNLDHAVTIEGYSAADIHRLAPFLDGIGVYNFLVTLREKPDFAKKIIAQGFPNL